MFDFSFLIDTYVRILIMILCTKKKKLIYNTLSPYNNPSKKSIFGAQLAPQSPKVVVAQGVHAEKAGGDS